MREPLDTSMPLGLFASELRDLDKQIAERDRLLDRLFAERDAILAAYVRRSPRPDCHPDYRWRATLPGGETRWFGSREDAVKAIVEAADTGEDTRDGLGVLWDRRRGPRDRLWHLGDVR